MRNITLTISGDTLIASSNLAGYAGEHKNTRLTIPLPTIWRGYNCHLLFRRSTDPPNKGLISDTINVVDGAIVFDLPQALMVAGALNVQLQAKESGDDPQVALSAQCVLTIKTSTFPIKAVEDQYAGLLETTIQEVKDAAAAAESATAAANAAASAATFATTTANTAADAANTAAAAATDAIATGIDGIAMLDTDNNVKYLLKLRLIDGKPAIEYEQS